MTTGRLSGFCWVLIAGGCATEGGEDGGDEHLPDRGIAGWQSIGTKEAPFALAPPEGSGEVWGGPAALTIDDEVLLYYHALSAESSVIRRVASSDGFTFGAVRDVLDGARDPSVATCGAGCFLMAFVDAAGELGLAESHDGLAFDRVAATGLAPGREPSIVVDDDRILLYSVSAEGIVLAEAGRDRVFGPPVVVLRPGEGCVDAFGEPEACWDDAGMGGPDVRLATTAAGRTVFRMFFSAGPSDAADLGFAASFDGRAWSRYAFSPVVAERFAETAPSAVVAPRGRGYWLYWEEQRSEVFGGIVAARSPAAQATETW